MATVTGAHCDNVNQQFSIIGVQGTLGTADIGGTAETLPIGVNPKTGAVYVDGGSSGSINLSPLSGVVLTTAVSIGTVATAIPGTALTNRKAIIFYNSGTATVYMGGTTVTTVNGLPIVVGDYSPPMDLGVAVLYGISANAGGTVNILEVS